MTDELNFTDNDEAFDASDDGPVEVDEVEAERLYLAECAKAKEAGF